MPCPPHPPTSVGHSVSHSVGQSVRQSVRHSVSHSASQPGGQPSSRSANEPINQSVNRSACCPSALDCFSGEPKRWNLIANMLAQQVDLLFLRVPVPVFLKITLTSKRRLPSLAAHVNSPLRPKINVGRCWAPPPHDYER